MATPASIRNHPLHPMLVVFPFALWTTAVVFDIVGLVTGNNALRTVAFYDMAAGIVGAVAAAVPGIIDYFSLRGRARRVGTYHAALNVTALALFTVSWLLRTQWGAGYVGRDSWLPELTAIVGVALIFPSGWLGGSLVYEHGVGVSREPAHADPRIGRRAA
ncbi:MAG TPA: DUF2231 domain-containing protein [Terriglobales bacterium]|nr:DUF2231 domain-containing protein [Terriglobales bacterium]